MPHSCKLQLPVCHLFVCLYFPSGCLYQGSSYSGTNRLQPHWRTTDCVMFENTMGRNICRLAGQTSPLHQLKSDQSSNGSIRFHVITRLIIIFQIKLPMICCISHFNKHDLFKKQIENLIEKHPFCMKISLLSAAQKGCLFLSFLSAKISKSVGCLVQN